MRRLYWTLSVPAAFLCVSGVVLGGGKRTITIPDPLLQATQQPTTPQGIAPSEEVAQPARPAVTYPARPAPAPVPRMPPLSPFAVKADSGAWMICAAHYTGPYASYFADQVVRQLRDRRINCYVFNHADEHRRQENEENLRRLRENPDSGVRPRFTRVEEQCAVLIGGFKDMESARKALPTVKKLAAPKVTTPDGTPVCDQMVEFGERQDRPSTKIDNRAVNLANINPFERSFVIRNPKAPTQNDDRAKMVDPLWKQLNSNEPYSLLKCKKNYTILVKCYQGSSEVVTHEKINKEGGVLAKLGFGKSGPNVMQAVGTQAHALAKFLRGYQFEAYVLHTRQGSLVTIGGFDRMEDEELRQMQQKLGTLKLMPTGSTPTESPYGQGVFDLIPNPQVMPIPKL